MSNYGSWVGSNRPRTETVRTGYGRSRSFGMFGLTKRNEKSLKIFGRAKYDSDEYKDLIERNSNSKERGGANSGFFDYEQGDFYYKHINWKVSYNKTQNLLQWRRMVGDAKVGDCLDDICDACINPDSSRGLINIKINNPRLLNNQNVSDNIHEEFLRFVRPLNLARKGWNAFRTLFTEAEVAWEMVTDNEDSRKGVIGFKLLKNEYLDVVRDPDTDEVEGFIYKTDNMSNEVVLLPNQVIYIDSGIWSEDGLTLLPFIHRATKVWRQLSLLEDAAVIYRIVRAPERRVFTIDVSEMPKNRAEEYMKGLMAKYRQKKVYDPATGELSSQYNPISMSEDYWFASRNGQNGAKVDTLAGGKNLGEIEDIEYFQRIFYKTLKVPSARGETKDGGGNGASGKRSETSNDELKFAKFVVRNQDNMASGIKEGFITHLSLTGMWSQYNMQPQDIDVSFNEPVNFRELEDIAINSARAEIYTSFSQDDFFHKKYLAERFLKMTPEEFKRNQFFKDQSQKGAENLGTDGGSIAPDSVSFDDGGGAPFTGAPVVGEEPEAEEPEADLGDIADIDMDML